MSIEGGNNMKNEVYQKARTSKNSDYDGTFFFAVKTTGIFCRPSCPSPVAKEKNVEYYTSMYEALDKGYRPCLRCRPDIHVDYYNGNVDGAELVEKALIYIYDGYLIDHSVSQLAQLLSVSDRHLRKLFVVNMGMPPVKISKYHKALFAKKMLLTSDLKITDIAFASGFGSIRQFNHVMKEVFTMAPSEIREKLKIDPVALDGITSIQLDAALVNPYKNYLLSKQKWLIKGVEDIVGLSYMRTFLDSNSRGYYQIRLDEAEDCLSLEIYTSSIKSVMKIYNHVKRLDAYFRGFEMDYFDNRQNKKTENENVKKYILKNGIKTPSDYPEALNYFVAFSSSDEK